MASLQGAAAKVIVGVGASAGGLKAFQHLLECLPTDTGLAFVFIQHLDPDHPSMMSDLLGRRTEMSVAEIQDGTVPLENQVYMIPPGTFVDLRDGALRLTARDDRGGQPLAIDTFFRSLAQEKAEDAAGILLSGTGTDGLAGLRDIRDRGGLCMVQTPDTADHGDMPANGLKSGIVDQPTTIADMPGALISFAAHVRHRNDKGDGKQAQDFLNKLIATIGRKRDVDFRFYKPSTLIRRTQRRMSLAHMDREDDYLTLLRNDANEQQKLTRDLLISVTSFFRDRDAFDALRTEALPRILEDKTEEPIRVWVPGCATGEEPYTIAMLLLDALERENRNQQLQVFATDVDHEALRIARAGRYPEPAIADLPQYWRDKYIIRRDAEYQVKGIVRECVTFAEQNLFADPPFSRLDLISCRNLLIYLKAQAQSMALGSFSFALRPNGFLLLGTSETIGKAEDVFEVVSKRHRLFRRTQANPSHWIGLRSDIRQAEKQENGNAAPALPKHDPKSTKAIALEAILAHTAPASVLIDGAWDVKYFHNNTARFLSQPSGMPTRNLTEMLRHGLKARVRALMREVTREGHPVTASPAMMRTEDHRRARVRVTISPTQSAKDDLYIVSFTEDLLDLEGFDDDGEQSKTVRHLEQELSATREDLQSTIEELETTNEELRASNEEFMSVNEEFQSTNEELESSREELQSLNEELSTVNNQLAGKVHALEQANNDLKNVVDATDVAILFINSGMLIARFNSPAQTLLHLRDADLGRPISDFRLTLLEPGVEDRIRRVIATLEPSSRTIEGPTRRVFRETIRPYRTDDEQIDGVVIDLVEVTKEKASERELSRREYLLNAVMRQATDGVMVFYPDGTCFLVNDAARWMLTGSLEGDAPTHADEMLPLVRHLNGEAISPDESPIWLALHHKRSGEAVFEIARRQHGRVILEVKAAPVTDDDGNAIASVALLRNVTEARRNAADLEQAIREAATANAAKSRFLAGMSHDLRTPLNAILGFNEALSVGLYGELQNSQIEPLSNIAQAGQLLRGLIDDILDLARIEANELQLEPELLAIAPLLEEAAQAARTGRYGRAATVVHQVTPKALRIVADRRRLKQVVINILHNAFKYGPDDQTITLRAWLDDPPGDRPAGPSRWFYLEIDDQGPGIPAAERTAVFEPFVRRKGESPSIEGTGLGLALARQLSHAHGGDIGLSDSPDGGLRVRLCMPSA